MSATPAVKPSPAAESPALAAAFAALQSYDRASNRAALVPLDEAVAAALPDAVARWALEDRLLALLQGQVSVVARQYVCAKLTLVGTKHSVKALAALLAEEPLNTAARRALEALPGSEPTKALREQLPKLTGLPRIGVMIALGVRRDPSALPPLTALLKNSDQATVIAAVAAIGEIGTPRAAKVLRAFNERAPDTLRAAVADAALTCAEHLQAAGNASDARALYAMLAEPEQPPQVQLAAERGLGPPVEILR